jgi:hypothetical protein
LLLQLRRWMQHRRGRCSRCVCRSVTRILAPMSVAAET